MSNRLTQAALLAVACALPGASLATDRAEARSIAAPAQGSQDGALSEEIGVVISSGQEQLWSGPLVIGGQGGNASVSLSKHEFAPPCPGKPQGDSSQWTSNFSISFSMYRQNWPQEPDKFNVSVNWNRPLSACEGLGSDTLGLNRVVAVPKGGTVSVAGTGGLVVRLTRR